MVVSRTDAVEVAVEELKPEVVGVIISQDILEPVVMKCSAIKSQATFRYRIVDSPIVPSCLGRVELETVGESLRTLAEPRGYVPARCAPHYAIFC